MKGKKASSQYIITNLFAMDYFYYYSKPVLFSAYFFPFVDYEKNVAYDDKDIERKIQNIRNNKHGNLYNYATQGFGNIAFYEPYITFEYFYERLVIYDTEKNKYFSRNENLDFSIESSQVKEDLIFILSKRFLYLKRGVPILDAVKKQLLYDLKDKENKYIIAEILYYIVCDKHVLPNVHGEILESIKNKLDFGFKIKPNVEVAFREQMDEDPEILCERLKKAKEIQLLCLDGISMFGNGEILRQNKYFGHELKAILEEDLFVEIIISESGCLANQEACKCQINIEHLYMTKQDLAAYTMKKILKVKKELKGNKIELKITNLSLPYSLFIVKFENSQMDYLKLDIYSPFISENKQRPSMYIFRKNNPMLFDHFQSVFDNLWKNDEYCKIKDRKG